MLQYVCNNVCIIIMCFLYCLWYIAFLAAQMARDVVLDAIDLPRGIFLPVLVSALPRRPSASAALCLGSPLPWQPSASAALCLSLALFRVNSGYRPFLFWHDTDDFLFTFHSIYVFNPYLVLFLRYSKLMVENGNAFYHVCVVGVHVEFGIRVHP